MHQPIIQPFLLRWRFPEIMKKETSTTTILVLLVLALLSLLRLTIFFLFFSFFSRPFFTATDPAPFPPPEENGCALILKKVYADCLTHVHPAYLYRTVNVCNHCYCVYKLMDERRQNLVEKKEKRSVDHVECHRCLGLSMCLCMHRYVLIYLYAYGCVCLCFLCIYVHLPFGD